MVVVNRSDPEAEHICEARIPPERYFGDSEKDGKIPPTRECGQPAIGLGHLFGVRKWLCEEHVMLYRSSGALESITP